MTPQTTTLFKLLLLIHVTLVWTVASQKRLSFGQRLMENHSEAPVANTPLLHISYLYPTEKTISMVGGAVYVGPGEGEATKINVNPYYIKLASKQTNGQFMMMEGIVLPGEGPPLHSHHFEDEAFYVLEGEVQFKIGNQTLLGRQGSCVYAPRGMPHSFRNVNGTNARPARLQFWFSPGGIENYFEQMSRVSSQNPPNHNLAVQISKEWGVDIIGPPDWSIGS